MRNRINRERLSLCYNEKNNQKQAFFINRQYRKSTQQGNNIQARRRNKVLETSSSISSHVLPHTDKNGLNFKQRNQKVKSFRHSDISGTDAGNASNEVDKHNSYSQLKKNDVIQNLKKNILKAQSSTAMAVGSRSSFEKILRLDQPKRSMVNSIPNLIKNVVLFYSKKIQYCINLEGNNHHRVEKMLQKRGNWEKYNPQSDKGSEIHFYWGKGPTQRHNKNQSIKAKANKAICSRIQGSSLLADKARLYENIVSFCSKHQISNEIFLPVTFCFTSRQSNANILQNVRQFVEFFTYIKNQTNLSNSWMFKPTNLNRGQGIVLFNTIEDLSRLVYPLGGRRKQIEIKIVLNRHKLRGLQKHRQMQRFKKKEKSFLQMQNVQRLQKLPTQPQRRFSNYSNSGSQSNGNIKTVNRQQKKFRLKQSPSLSSYHYEKSNRIVEQAQMLRQNQRQKERNVLIDNELEPLSQPMKTVRTYLFSPSVYYQKEDVKGKKEKNRHGTLQQSYSHYNHHNNQNNQAAATIGQYKNTKRRILKFQQKQLTTNNDKGKVNNFVNSSSAQQSSLTALASSVSQSSIHQPLFNRVKKEQKYNKDKNIGKGKGKGCIQIPKFTTLKNNVSAECYQEQNMGQNQSDDDDDSGNSHDQNQQEEECTQEERILYQSIVKLVGGSQQSQYGQRCRKKEFVIQKYIENPYLIDGKKFDIRVWALVDQFKNYYVFKEPYMRFSAETYKLDSSTMKNNLMHLTNHALQVDGKKYTAQTCLAPISVLKNHIKENAAKNKTNETYARIEAEIQRIIAISLEATLGHYHAKNKDIILAGPAEFQIYGYDFLLDRQLKVRLVQANCNPSITEDSKLLKHIVPKMLDDTFKLTIDRFIGQKKTSKLKTAPKIQYLQDQSFSWKRLGTLGQTNLNSLRNSVQAN